MLKRLFKKRALKKQLGSASILGALFITALLVLSGCGQKGDLYLPKPLNFHNHPAPAEHPSL